MAPKGKKAAKRKPVAQPEPQPDAKRAPLGRGAKEQTARQAARARLESEHDEAILGLAHRLNALESRSAKAWGVHSKAEIISWVSDLEDTKETKALLALKKYEDMVVFAAQCDLNKSLKHVWTAPTKEQMRAWMESQSADDGGKGPAPSAVLEDEDDSGDEGPHTPRKNLFPAAAAEARTPATVARPVHHTAASSASSAPAPAVVGGRPACPHCRFVLPLGADSQHKCGECALRIDLPEDHRVNLVLFEAWKQKLSAPVASAAASSGTQPTQTPSKLSGVLEEYCHKQREEHGWPDREEFAAGARALTHPEAFVLSRRAYLASNYADPPTELVDLIRSGKLRDVGLAMPRTHDEMQILKEKRTTAAALQAIMTEAGSAGESTLKGMCVLKNRHDFEAALHCTIIPALIDKPAAIMEWCTIARSLALVEAKTNSWGVALKFLNNTLRSRASGSLGAFNLTTLTDAEGAVRAQAPPRAAASSAPPPQGKARAAKPKQAPQQRSSASSAAASAPASVISAASPNRRGPPGPLLDITAMKPTGDVCLSYATRGDGTCSYGADCKKPHMCCWKGCDEKHSGRICSKAKTL